MNEESTITPPLEVNMEQIVNTTVNVPEVAIAPLEVTERETASIEPEEVVEEEESESILSEEDEAFLNEVIENQHQEIPPISEDYHDETARFSGAEWFNKIKEKVIIVGGAGGISSNAIFQLARIHPKSIYIFDNDKVEEVNLAGQMFGIKDIDKYKVDAIAETVSYYSKYTDVFAMRELYTRNSFTSDIMICGFDNMEARKVFFNNWRKHVELQKDKSKCLYIDARLSFDTLQILTIVGTDIYNQDRYEKEFLFSDEEADETVCSLKQTTFMACMIASFIVNNVVNFCANEIVPMIKQLPFFIEYDCNMMYLKEED